MLQIAANICIVIGAGSFLTALVAWVFLMFQGVFVL